MVGGSSLARLQEWLQQILSSLISSEMSVSKCTNCFLSGELTGMDVARSVFVEGPKHLKNIRCEEPDLLSGHASGHASCLVDRGQIAI